MKICVITTVHPPDDVRINKELKTLRDAGHKVHYIAPEGCFDFEGIDYIPISKYSGRFKRLFIASKEAIKRAFEVDAEVYHFHDPELISLGLKLKKHGKKVIYDIHEDYPSVIMMKAWIPSLLRPIISKSFSWYQSRAVKRFDGIIVTVEEYLSSLRKMNSVAIVPNYPDLDFLFSIPRPKTSNDTDNIKFVYVGSVDEDRSIAEIIEAFTILKNKGKNISLEIIGPLYSEKLRILIENAKTNYSSFSYYPRLFYEDAMKRTAAGHVGLLIVHRGKSKEESSPLKMYEYMALGMPQIASNFTAWRSVLDEGPCALYVDPDDPMDIAEKMESFCDNPKLIEELGTNAKQVVRKYSWSAIENRLLSLYEKILKE